MIEHSGKSIPLVLVFPILGSLRGEQVEKTLVCGRNGAAKIDLPRLFRQIEFRQKNSVLNQVVMIRHRSAENLFLEVRLLGLASKIEVRNRTTPKPWKCSGHQAWANHWLLGLRVPDQIRN